MDMIRDRCAFILLTVIVIPLYIASSASADLQPVVQEIGKISVSVDAEGNNNSNGGTIQVNKPTGATVRSALLMAASNFNRVIADGDVVLAGVPVSWDRRVFNNAGTFSATFFNNVFANVTSIVKPIIDAAPSGLNLLQVTEVGTSTIDGAILIVIFNDPSQTTDNSVILLFGGQNTQGDRFQITLAEPLDLTGPNPIVNMGLGISFGFQGASGTGMLSIIDINGLRLTSSAGGEDDGGGFNGGLITVGGIGDSNANPPPSAPSSGFRTDDELYDLLPFVRTGDTSILVETINPTDDDNIFFAYFSTSVPSAILLNIPPPGSRMVVGNINPDYPTIVLTHGWQEEGEDIADLWTGNGDRQAAALIRGSLGDRVDQVNIVRYIWEEALTRSFLPTDVRYLEAQRNAFDAGTRLASELLRSLGPTYNKPIHFIGHSLGTVVNAWAARAFLNAVPNITQAQFTALDRPHDIDKIPGLNSQDESFFGYNADFFARVLPIGRTNLNLRIDNYYSLDGAGVGDVANGPVYNHLKPNDLINPNDLDDTIFLDEGFDNNHSGVQQWYRWTMDPNGLYDSFRICSTETGQLLNLPLFFDQSLNPCQRGWYWSLNGPNPNAFPDTNGDPLTATTISPPRILQSQEFGCRIETNGAVTTIICHEQSSPFAILQVDIPDDAILLSFEYRFTNIGDGDYAVVLLDDRPIWVLAGASTIQQGTFTDSGPIPTGGLTGEHRLTVALYGVGAPNAEFEIRNFMVSLPTLNSPPVAQCQNITVPTAPGVCTASASVNNGSFDPDGDPITLAQSPAGPYGLGTTNVTLTVTDDRGASDSCTAIVMVQDTTAPVISSVSANPSMLWPPNHKMVRVAVAVSASDVCDAAPVCRISDVSSNEPVNGTGDGDTAPDWKITGNFTVNLRAERSGTGTGRVYTNTVACTDASGNRSTKTVTVTVPHNR